MGRKPLLPLVAAVAAVGLLSACGSAGSAPATEADVDGAVPVAAAPAPPPTQLARRPTARISDGTRTVRVAFAAAPAAGAPTPKLSPAVRGSWSVAGNAEVFTPASTLAPCAKYTLTVPAGTQSSGHAAWRHARRYHLQVACPGAKAAQLALARLHYLPYQARGLHSSTVLAGAEPRGAAAHAAFAIHSRLHHSISGAPTVRVGQLDAITKGALMSFQSDHGLTVDGALGGSTWQTLLSAEAAGARRKDPYTWVVVTKGSSESLVLHVGSAKPVSTPVNTGVAGAETPDGTFPIFERLPVTTMIGTNPDGSHYNDPGVKWVNYFNGGDAVHAFERGSYGTPQSNGCVELQDAPAQRVYSALHIGDPVIVRG